MPLSIAKNAPTLLIRRDAFEQASLARADIESRFVLTADEFRVERDLIAIGPLHGADTAGQLLALLEEAGLAVFDDVFELSGTWPDWLEVFAASAPRRTG